MTIGGFFIVLFIIIGLYGLFKKRRLHYYWEGY